VTLAIALRTSAPVEPCYPGCRRATPVLVDSEGAQYLSSMPPTRLLCLVQEGLFEVRKLAGQTYITSRSFDRLVDMLPTGTSG